MLGTRVVTGGCRIYRKTSSGAGFALGCVQGCDNGKHGVALGCRHGARKQGAGWVEGGRKDKPGGTGGRALRGVRIPRLEFFCRIGGKPRGSPSGHPAGHCPSELEGSIRRGPVGLPSVAAGVPRMVPAWPVGGSQRRAF